MEGVEKLLAKRKKMKWGEKEEQVGRLNSNENITEPAIQRVEEEEKEKDE